MADTVRITWLYPPNWDGTYWGGAGGGSPDPPDNVPIGWKRMKLQLTNLSDGTGESDVVKLDRSELYGIDGLACEKIVIDKIKYQTYGMSVRLEWDMTPDQLIAMLPENSEGCIEGPFFPDYDGAYGVGETGDLLLTTIGHTANDSYNITLDIKIKT